MQVGEFSTVINLALLVAVYLVLQPLKAQIENLTKSLDVMSGIISKLQELFSTERIHIAKVDESVKSAHLRVDELERKMEELQKRCIDCSCRGD